MNFSASFPQTAIKVRTVGAKPTEGFWKFGHAGDFLWIGPSHDEKPVALVPWNHDDARDPGEARANAAMMAAAPDMLAALKHITRCSSIDERWLTPVRAAIEKAESA